MQDLIARAAATAGTKPAGAPLSNLHPVFQQALAPFVLLPGDRKLAADFAGPDFPLDPDAVAFHQANDARALRLQMQAENSRTNFGATV